MDTLKKLPSIKELAKPKEVSAEELAEIRNAEVSAIQAARAVENPGGAGGAGGAGATETAEGPQVPAKNSNSKEQQAEELVYIIDNAWLEQWKAFVRGGERPGKISNDRLLLPNGSPRPDLQPAVDYRGLNEKEWMTFYQAYGGGPWIVRSEVNIYAAPLMPPSLSLKARQSFSSAAHLVTAKTEQLRVSASARLAMEGEIKSALECLAELSDDKIFEKLPKHLFQKAVGFAFITEIKAGFLFSGRGGSGIVIAKTNRGWSGPACFACGGIGAGLMAGISKINTIVVLNSQKAVDTFAGKGQFKLGGDLEVAIGPLGRNAGGDVRGTDGAIAPCYSYSFSKGLFAGIQIDGAVLVSRGSENARFYGREVDVKEILSGDVNPSNPPQPLKLLYTTLDNIIQGAERS